MAFQMETQYRREKWKIKTKMAAPDEDGHKTGCA